MASLTDIRVALAASLGTAISGLQASAYMLANPTTPHAHVLPGEVEYDKTLQRGLDELFLTVQLIVGTPSDMGAQMVLDEFLDDGPRSVKTAIEADPTLNGACSDLHVQGASGYRVYTFGEGRPPALGAEWRVRVIAPQS